MWPYILIFESDNRKPVFPDARNTFLPRSSKTVKLPSSKDPVGCGEWAARSNVAERLSSCGFDLLLWFIRLTLSLMALRNASIPESFIAVRRFHPKIPSVNGLPVAV